MKIKIAILNIALAMFIMSCDGNKTTGEDALSNSDIDKQETDGLLSDEWDQEKTNEFVKKAALIDMTEIRVGELAQQKAQDQGVKDYGKMLVDDHKKSSQDLQSIAQQLSAPVPQQLDEDHKNKVQKVEQMEQNNFKKDFLDMMVKDHEDAISKYEDAQENAQDQKLKEYAQKTLPVLKKHLERAKELQNSNQQE